MERLLSFCASRNVFVMIDETYVEFAPGIAAVTAVPFTRDYQNLMVLRGVSKFFAPRACGSATVSRVTANF